MMDILCIVPPFNYGSLDSIKSKCPNLGIGTLAAVLEEKEYDVKITDCFGLELTKKEIIENIREQGPNLILIGAVTANFSISMEILQAAKKINPNVVTIMGGPHVSVNPESSSKELGIIDYIVIGEAEETISELVDFVKGKNDLKKEEIKGIMYIDSDKKIVKTPERDVVKNIDELPIPAYHLFPMEKYHSYGWLNLGRKFTTMITSRGCPFKCNFCQSSIQAKYWRQRSAENVFKEIKTLYDKYDIRHIYFQDDEFCVNHRRIIDLCEKIVDAKMDLAWECLTRVNHMDDELLSAMKRGGCRSILFGVETGYEEGLKKINKPINLQQVIDAVKMTQKHGIMVKAAYILGFPWEGKEEIKKTIKFAKKVNSEIAFFNILNPYPGTPIYDQVIENNLFEQPENLDGHILHGGDPLLKTLKLTAEELRYWSGRAMLEYYLRPTFILKKLMKLRSFKEFKSNFLGGSDYLGLAFKKVLKKGDIQFSS